MKLGVAAAFCLGVLLLAASSLAGSGAKAPAPKIKTSAGVFSLDGVLLADRFPPGCEENGPICQVSEPGFRVLIVWLKAQRGAKPVRLSSPAATRGVYIKSASGARTSVWSAGLFDGYPMVAFTPRAKQRGFRLFWPGNKPVVLPKPTVQLGPG